MLSDTGTLKNSTSEVEGDVERRGGEACVKLNLSTDMLLLSLFTCCKLRSASCSQDGCTETSQPFSSSSTADHHSRRKPSSYLSLLLPLGGKKRVEMTDFVQFFSGPHYIPTFLRHGFNILLSIDEYNYIQYLCLFMFTDRFSHFISVSGVLCLFV